VRQLLRHEANVDVRVPSTGYTPLHAAAELSGPSRGVYAALAFPTLKRFSMALLYGCARRLTAKNGGSRPGQRPRGAVLAAGGERRGVGRAPPRAPGCDGGFKIYHTLPGYILRS
jgi:hypothetical protein